MAVRHARFVLLAAATLGLSGCSTIFHSAFFRSLGFHSHKPEMALKTKATATPFTDAGRKYLAAGDSGLAIEAFQHALGTGEPEAAALNGLGVAYARIDRFETAQRLFEQAIALEPDNQQYAANMARLMRSPALAMRHDADIAASLAAVTPEVPAPKAAAPQPGQLVQVSANEFRIATAPSGAAPVTVRHAATAGSRVAITTRHAVKHGPMRAPHAASAARPRAPGTQVEGPRDVAVADKARATVIANPYAPANRGRTRRQAGGAAL